MTADLHGGVAAADKDGFAATKVEGRRKRRVWYDPRSGGRVRYVESEEDGFYRKYILEEKSGTMQWVRWKDPPRLENERKLVYEKKGEGYFVERFIEREDKEEDEFLLSDDSNDNSEEERRRMQPSYFMPRARKRSSWQSGDTDIHYDPWSNGCIRYERGDDGHYRKFRLQYRDGVHDWVPVVEQRNLSEVVYQRSPEGFYLEVLLPLPVGACLSKDRRGWMDDATAAALFARSNSLRQAAVAASLAASSPCRANHEDETTIDDDATRLPPASPPINVFVHRPYDTTHLAELIQRTSVFSEAERLLVEKHHLSPRPCPAPMGRGRTLGGGGMDRQPIQDAAEWSRQAFDPLRRRRLTDLTDPLRLQNDHPDHLA